MRSKPNAIYQEKGRYEWQENEESETQKGKGEWNRTKRESERKSEDSGETENGLKKQDGVNRFGHKRGWTLDEHGRWRRRVSRSEEDEKEGDRRWKESIVYQEQTMQKEQEPEDQLAVS